MGFATHLQPLLNHLLIALLIVGAAALSVVVHRKNLLDLLVTKQSELIAKLRQAVQQPAQRTERSLAHLRDTVKWLQARYRRDYASAQQPPQRVTTPEELQQVVMAAALQTLGKEFGAMREHREPEAAWEEIQGVLHTLLDPVCLDAGRNNQPTTTDDDVVALQERLDVVEQELKEERATRAKLERELDEMQALYLRLLDEIQRQVGEIPGVNHVSQWIAQRRSDFDAGVRQIPQLSNTEIGELSRKALADSLQKSEAEMKNLRNALAGQHELVAKLKYKLAQDEGEHGRTTDAHAELPEWGDLERALRDSETCIKTLELDLEETHTYAHRLENEVAMLKQNVAELTDPSDRPETPREEKELVDTIKVMEDAAEGYSYEIEQLRKELEQQRSINFILRDQLGMSEADDAESAPEVQHDSGSEPPG